MLEKSITPMRSFVAAPMRYRSLLLAGDAAHIVPPTGAKGLNLAVADVTLLAQALTDHLCGGSDTGLEEFSDRCLARVWRAQHFSWWMTTMLHFDPQDDGYGRRLQRSQLDYVTSSTAAATSLAENYVGLPLAQTGRVGSVRSPMAELTTLQDAIAGLVRDGDAVAIEGFTHLIPFAAGHEILRQGRRDLELVRMTPDILYDQMIGMGAARKLVFSYGGNPGVGSLHRFRDAVEHGWPHPIELEEHSHAGMANRYAAGAARLPFAVMRGYVGTDLAPLTQVRPITCPFTGEELVAVPALRPDVAIVHAQEADREGNVHLWGIPGVQKEAVLSADRALVTVERIVDELRPRPGGDRHPGWVIDAVAEAPGGSQPSYSLGITTRDNDFYRFWDKLSRDREEFQAWMQEHVLNEVKAH